MLILAIQSAGVMALAQSQYTEISSLPGLSSGFTPQWCAACLCVDQEVLRSQRWKLCLCVWCLKKSSVSAPRPTDLFLMCQTYNTLSLQSP